MEAQKKNFGKSDTPLIDDTSDFFVERVISSHFGAANVAMT